MSDPLRVIGVDAVGSALCGRPDQPGRKQSGIGNSLIPGNLDYAQIDEVHWLNDREAFAATRALARDKGIFAGKRFRNGLRRDQCEPRPDRRAAGRGLAAGGL
ncbi:hypothetical protein [Streptomyces sp. I05A-00742]|uniref:hypothetical protein n=1 Tax=Streptomyces sp. I05A-00742 TaxID=2732853 RepID=UPI002016AF01|nr:hypothetical protein [Streptomyces sp. I05A-00742]